MKGAVEIIPSRLFLIRTVEMGGSGLVTRHSSLDKGEGGDYEFDGAAGVVVAVGDAAAEPGDGDAGGGVQDLLLYYNNLFKIEVLRGTEHGFR